MELRATSTSPVPPRSTPVSTMKPNLFFPIVWSLFVIAAFATSIRIITRKTSFRIQFFWWIASLFLFLTCCIINTILVASYYHGSAENGLNSFLKLQFCSNILYLSSLWLAKLGILSSYYDIVHSFVYLKRAWLSILGMVAMAYVCCVISYPYCSVTSK